MLSAAGANPAIAVTRFSHSFNQPSVIAKIPGSSSDSLVIVGAHLDSTGGSSSARGPGAGKHLPDPTLAYLDPFTQVDCHTAGFETVHVRIVAISAFNSCDTSFSALG